VSARSGHGLVPRRRRWAWRGGTALVLVAMAVVLLGGNYQPVSGNVAGAGAEPARESPCLPGEPVAIMDSPRIVPAQADAVRYNSVPPTSGPYFAFTVAPGVYDRPVPEGLTVSAMRRGLVIIQYAPDLPGSDVDALTRLAKRHGADVVLAPYPPLERGVALTAWGRIDLLAGYDEAQIAAFVEALRGRYVHGWAATTDCP
jgi:hypothetical protein